MCVCVCLCLCLCTLDFWPPTRRKKNPNHQKESRLYAPLGIKREGASSTLVKRPLDSSLAALPLSNTWPRRTNHLRVGTNGGGSLRVWLSTLNSRRRRKECTNWHLCTNLIPLQQLHICPGLYGVPTSYTKSTKCATINRMCIIVGFECLPLRLVGFPI